MWHRAFWPRVWRPDFWVCDYRRSDGMESGRFAALGETREEAERDALAHVGRAAWTDGTFEVRLTKPHIGQRIRAAYRHAWRAT